MSSRPKQAESNGSIRDMLRECVLYGIFFKAVAVDLALLRPVMLKLSYQLVFEEMSAWAQRAHYRLKRQLCKQGVELLATRKQGRMYAVEVRINGYRQEAVYSIELLHAECQEQLRVWLARRGEDILQKGEHEA